jgi:glycerophosphoryl diester phosphodiesterase
MSNKSVFIFTDEEKDVLEGIEQTIQTANNEILNIKSDLEDAFTFNAGEVVVKQNLDITDDLTVGKTLTVSDPITGQGNIRLGTGTLEDMNDLALISSNQYSLTDDAATELLLYKGNNTQTHGPDQIRLKAGQIVFETYETFTANNTTEPERSNMVIDRFGNVNIQGKLTVNGASNINNILTVNNVVSSGSIRGNLMIGDEKLLANKMLCGNNTYGFTNTLLYPLQVEGTTLLNGNTTITGNLSVDGTITGHEEDYTLLFDELMNDRNAVIAHRFSKLTAQPYSLSLLRNLIDRGVRLIEFDVSITTDGLFYLSHGNMDEIAPSQRPAQNSITKANYNKPTINFTNQGLSNGDTLPSLKEAWDFLKAENVCILMEAKTTATTDLLAYCQQIGITPNRMIFQDFQTEQLDIFKNAGYKTMILKTSALTTKEKADYDYYCCNETNISTFQADSGIPKFIYYTNNNPYDFIKHKNANSKLSGCFSDCALATYKQLSTPDRSLLDPRNGYVSVQHIGDEEQGQYTSVKANAEGHIVMEFKPQGNATSSDTVITYHGYKIEMLKYYTFSVEMGDKFIVSDWFGMVLRFGTDYMETDSNQVQALNTLFRGNQTVQCWKLIGGSASNIFSTTKTVNKRFITFIISRVNSGNDLKIEYRFAGAPGVRQTTPDLTCFITMSDLNQFNFSNTNDMYMSFIRNDDMNGKIVWYDRDYENYHY